LGSLEVRRGGACERRRESSADSLPQTRMEDKKDVSTPLEEWTGKEDKDMNLH